MTSVLSEKVSALEIMQKYPETLYYRGNTQLLKHPMISIVGTRKPSQYTREMTLKLAQGLSHSGFIIVSGAAMGVDAIAHKGAGSKNTVAVLANGLDIKYPAINKTLISDIENNGLLLSTYPDTTPSLAWQFVARNEVVVGLGELLIVCEADSKSGSMRSVEYAQKMGKPIYVLSHRIGESEGTQQLVKEGKATLIVNIDDFVASLNGKVLEESPDEFLDFCKTNSCYDEIVSRYGDKVFEYELEGKIEVVNGNVLVV